MAGNQENTGRLRFAPVRNTTLRHEVLDPIRNAILFGQLPVGKRLMEAEIAAQMGVSRVPVREALRQLEQEGLIVSYPHRGVEVASVDEAEVDLLYSMRADLEGFAVQSLMRREVAELVDALQQLVNGMRAAASEGQRVELAEKDLEFHRLIISASGYRTLGRVWNSMDGPIRARLHRCLNGPFQQKLIWYTAESHHPIVDAITSGDPERAVTAIKTHILETKQLIQEGIASSYQET